jgi:hypothetical protein
MKASLSKAVLLTGLAAGANAFGSIQVVRVGTTIGNGHECALRQPMRPLLREAPSSLRGRVLLMAKKKKGTKKKDAAGVSVSDDEDKESSADDEEDFVVPKRDKSLEAMFVDIPKEALAPAPSLKKKDDKKGPDPDAAFGLSGDVVRFIKKGTYACMALLVLALVVVRSPLINVINPEAPKLEQAKKAEREKLDKEGKALPGVRPFPSLQATQEEVDKMNAEGRGSAVKVVDEKALGNVEGVEVNIGGGQKIKLVPKKIPKNSETTPATDAPSKGAE